MKESNIYRRFELINAEKEKELLSLIKEKHLSVDDLRLIISTIKFSDITCEDTR